MHADAAYRWTVPELAAASGLSRAAFARSFQQALGQAPMQYLTEWRMTLARDHLRTGELTLTQIAERTGYTSPTRSPRRSAVTTDAPGRWRREEAFSEQQRTQEPRGPSGRPQAGAARR